MSTPGNVAMLRRQLATELRQLRELTGRTVADVARSMSWSEAKLSRIETAKSGINDGDLKRLLNGYGVDDRERERLVKVAAVARQRFRRNAGPELPNAYTTYIALESEAAMISAYQPRVIHGLLQTAEYATAVEHGAGTGEDSLIFEERVKVRMGRQVVLARENPPRLCAILDESALRRPVGNAEIMRRQLYHLTNAATQPMTEILVVPVATGARAGLHGSFVLLDFALGSDQPLVYCEGLTGGVVLTKQEEVRMYRAAFESLRSFAFDRAETIEFIKALAESHG